MMITRLSTAKVSLLSRERGITLLEVLLGLAILVIVAVAYISALSTSSVAVRNADKRVSAEIVARSQLEHTKSLSFQTAPYTYPSITQIPTGYSVTSDAIAVAGRDGNIQRITVTVQKDSQAVLSIEDFKLNR